MNSERPADCRGLLQFTLRLRAMVRVAGWSMTEWVIRVVSVNDTIFLPLFSDRESSYFGRFIFQSRVATAASLFHRPWMVFYGRWFYIGCPLWHNRVLGSRGEERRGGLMGAIVGIYNYPSRDFSGWLFTIFICKASFPCTTRKWDHEIYRPYSIGPEQRIRKH